MPLVFNGNTVENLTYNGQEVVKATYNGTVIFEKTVALPTITFSGDIFSGVENPWVDVYLSAAYPLVVSNFSSSQTTFSGLVQVSSTHYRLELGSIYSRGASITISENLNGSSKTYTVKSRPVTGRIEVAYVSGATLYVSGWALSSAYGLCTVAEQIEVTVVSNSSGWTDTFSAFVYVGTQRNEVKADSGVAALCYDSNSGAYGWALSKNYGAVAKDTFTVTAKAVPRIGEPSVLLTGSVTVVT